MTLDLWTLAILLSKLVAYISFASLTGGFFILWLYSTGNLRASGAEESQDLRSFAFARTLLPFFLLNSLLGLASTLVFFLLQVGMINQSGMLGMFDWLMTTILMQTAVGTGVGLKVASFVLLGIASLCLYLTLILRQTVQINVPFGALIVLGVGLACAGYASLGHVASLGALEQFVMGLHMLAIATWVGAFYPLYVLCQSEPGTHVYPLMKRFGDWGWLITLCLSAAGAYLLTQLLSAPAELVATSYGRLIALKVLCVLCLLGLAALNKFRLVPSLKVAGAQPLARSIQGEMSLAFVILVVTAILSTVTGPEHLMG